MNRRALKALALLPLLSAYPLPGYAQGEAQDPAYSVVTLGTSLTLRGQWADGLAAQLAECRGEAVRVSVVAGAGQNSSWGLAQLDQVIAASPDLVTVEFAMNDASIVHGVSEAQTRENIGEIVGQLRSANPGIQIILMSTNPAHGWGWMSRFGLDGYYALNQSLADELDIDYLDLRPRWTERDMGQDIPDGVHPLPAAARDVFIPAIAKLAEEIGLCPTGANTP
jgi:lysophospholipase L1-like esterase